LLGFGALAITLVGITIETGHMLEGGKPDAYLGAGMIVFFIAIALACLHATKGQPRRPFGSVVGASLVAFGIAGSGRIVDLARAGELEDPIAQFVTVLLVMGVGAPTFYFSSLPRVRQRPPIDPASLDRRPE
jgi:uncharacterized membrane protein YhhN